MKQHIFKGLLAIGLLLLGISCDSHFDTVPGIIYDLEDTFTDKDKTENFLFNVYSYVPEETREKYFWDGNNRGGIWTGACPEASYGGNVTWHQSYPYNRGEQDSRSGLVNHFWGRYYQGIERASIFIQNVDKSTKLFLGNIDLRPTRKAEARALRAYFYFSLIRLYGPTVMLGEDPIPMNASMADMLKARSSIDECVEFIVNELDEASKNLPKQTVGKDLGRIDQAFCKAYKAQILLYAASPLFNGNPHAAKLQNKDGKQLIPTVKDQGKWEKARIAYKDFLKEFDLSVYSLHTVKADNGLTDHYESYRTATDGVSFTKELIFIRMHDNIDRIEEITPFHSHLGDEWSLRGGLQLGATQEIVDMYFTDKGLRIEDDPDYIEYTGIPGPEHYGWHEDYNDPIVPERNYFKKNDDKTLKQWAHREPRFYTNITFNGSTWINDKTMHGKITTELNYSGNSGRGATENTPNTGYGVRKMASFDRNNGRHFATLLRLAEIYLDYAETLSATGNYTEAMHYVNLVRKRAGIPEYGVGKDDNGYTRISYPANQAEVDKRIRRERLVELSFEWTHFYDVRRWMVAEMNKGDGWIYPIWHTGGAMGSVYGLNHWENAPKFFEKKKVVDRVSWDNKFYFLPIPEGETLKNPLLKQNLGWEGAVKE